MGFFSVVLILVIVIPNFCSNSVSVNNITSAQVARIVAACESNALLNEFMPQPDWANTPNEEGIYPGPLYKIRYRNGRVAVDSRRFPDGTADQRWYAWRTTSDHWGTKWEPDCHVYSRTDNSLGISLETAWSPPSDLWFEALSVAMPNAKITNTFSEEGCGFFGFQYSTNGVCVSECLEMEKSFEDWVVTQLTPQEAIIFNNPEEYPKDNQDLLESLRDDWNGGAFSDVIDNIVNALMSKIPKQSPILNMPA